MYTPLTAPTSVRRSLAFFYNIDLREWLFQNVLCSRWRWEKRLFAELRSENVYLSFFLPFFRARRKKFAKIRLATFECARLISHRHDDTRRDADGELSGRRARAIRSSPDNLYSRRKFSCDSGRARRVCRILTRYARPKVDARRSREQCRRINCHIWQFVRLTTISLWACILFQEIYRSRDSPFGRSNGSVRSINREILH